MMNTFHDEALPHKPDNQHARAALHMNQELNRLRPPFLDDDSPYLEPTASSPPMKRTISQPDTRSALLDFQLPESHLDFRLQARSRQLDRSNTRRKADAQKSTQDITLLHSPPRLSRPPRTPRDTISDRAEARAERRAELRAVKRITTGRLTGVERKLGVTVGGAVYNTGGSVAAPAGGWKERICRNLSQSVWSHRDVNSSTLITNGSVGLDGSVVAGVSEAEGATLFQHINKKPVPLLRHGAREPSLACKMRPELGGVLPTQFGMSPALGASVIPCLRHNDFKIAHSFDAPEQSAEQAATVASGCNFETNVPQADPTADNVRKRLYEEAPNDQVGKRRLLDQPAPTRQIAAGKHASMK